MSQSNPVNQVYEMIISGESIENDAYRMIDRRVNGVGVRLYAELL
jgi:hypothetical protein